VLNAQVTSGHVNPATPPWTLSNQDRFVDPIGDTAGGSGDHYQGSILSDMYKDTGFRYFEQLVGDIEVGLYSQVTYGLIREDLFSPAAAAFGGNPGHYGVQYEAFYGVDVLGVPGYGFINIPAGFLLEGDTTRFVVNFNTGKLWVGINSDWLGGGDPAAGTNPTCDNLPAGLYSPAFGAGRGGKSSLLRTTPGSFAFAMPAGATYWADPAP
jgi:hypothetical protein